MQQLQDYYQILGVSRQATEMEIRQAFRTLAKALHPDRTRTETQTTTNHDFRTINEAYETLKDREKRRAYDEELFRARTVVRHLDARQNSPRAFATGLTFGLVIALIGIAVMMYSDRLPFRKMRAKAQDSLNSSITAQVQRTPKAQDNRQVTAQSPTIETSKPETENLTEIPQQLSNREQNASADNDEALPGKAQNRLGSDLTPPSPTPSSEQKTASLESDPLIRSVTSTVQAQNRALSVKDRDAAKKEEVSPLASLAKPNQAILSRAISNTEANIDKGNERAGQALEHPLLSASPKPERAVVEVLAGPREHETLLRLVPGGGGSESFTDCFACPEMVVVPAGQFVMGSRPADSTNRFEESPAHRVAIHKPFAVSKYAVSNGNWRACIRDGGCRAAQLASFLARPDVSATRLSWYDAKGYVDWLSERTGKNYRLLTEAEWEYAIRGSATQASALPSELKRSRFDRVDYSGLFAFQNRMNTARAPSVNTWGLRNLRGNALEWVEDCWHSDYTKAPGDGSAWLSAGGGDCAHRVVRGGLLGTDFGASRPSARANEFADIRAPSIGFRVVRELFTSSTALNDKQ